MRRVRSSAPGSVASRSPRRCVDCRPHVGERSRRCAMLSSRAGNTTCTGADMKLSAFAVAGLMAWSGTFITHAHSQSAWRPTQNVEIIVPAAAGGANDLTGRLVQRIMHDAKLVPVNVNVVNRPGGGHSI